MQQVGIAPEVVHAPHWVIPPIDSINKADAQRVGIWLRLSHSSHYITIKINLTG
jgi:hypothetical protein